MDRHRSRGGSRRRAVRDGGGIVDLADREPELRGDVVDLIAAGCTHPGRAALRKARLRCLDDDRRRLAERHDRLGGGGADQNPVASRREGPLHAKVLVGLEIVEAVEAEPATLEQCGDRGIAHQLRVARVGRRRRGSSGRSSASGEQCLGVRARDQSAGEPALASDQRPELGDRRGPAGVVFGERHRPETPVARRLVQPTREKVGGEPVGDLQQPVGHRKLAPRLEQPDGAGAAKRSLVVEAVESLRRRDPRVGQKPGDEPGARELPGHVVVQVGVEAAVVRAELRRGAERQSRRFDVAQPEQAGGADDPLVKASSLRSFA